MRIEDTGTLNTCYILSRLMISGTCLEAQNQVPRLWKKGALSCSEVVAELLDIRPCHI